MFTWSKLPLSLIEISELSVISISLLQLMIKQIYPSYQIYNTNPWTQSVPRIHINKLYSTIKENKFRDPNEPIHPNFSNPSKPFNPFHLTNPSSLLGLKWIQSIERNQSNMKGGVKKMGLSMFWQNFLKFWFFQILGITKKNVTKKYLWNVCKKIREIK